MTSNDINNIPVLGKGFVSLTSCSPNGLKLHELSVHYCKNKKDTRIYNMANIVLTVKCPIFVQLSFPEFDLNYISIKYGTSNTEAFIPSIADIKAKTLKDSETIQQSIQQTTDALLLNPKAYQMDGCDVFTSQTNYPISVYNTLLVSGSLQNWLNYIKADFFPVCIDAYRKEISNIILAEYNGILNR